MTTLIKEDRSQLLTCAHDVAYCASCKTTWGFEELKDALCPECGADLSQSIALHLEECEGA